MALVGLELRFTGTASTYPTAKSGQGCSETCESRQTVFLLSKLDLKLSLASPCTQGENIEDKGGSVDHSDIENVLNIAHLNACKLVIKDDKLSIESFKLIAKLLETSCSHTCCRVVGGFFLHNDSNYLCIG